MKIELIRPLKIDNKVMKELDVNIEDLTGEDMLKVDLELRAEGDPYGFSNLYNQKALLKIASKASGLVIEDLQKLSAPDFLEVTFSVRNFLMGLSEPKEEQQKSEEFSSN